MIKRSIFVLLLLASPLVRAANWPEHPVLHAVRVSGPSPSIDGDLSDAAWQNAPEFTDFTQHDPEDGKPGTLPTSVRVVYDDHAIYFGAKMTDPKAPSALVVRRDTFANYDFLSINIDAQHDRLSGNAFTISPGNVQVDSVLYNDIGEDISWDGVWDSATKITSDGWIAEVRIPFSQLRFPDQPVHTWGINITRRTVRTNEWVRVVNTKKGDTGFVSHFADLDGIEGIHRGRPLELVPYAVARSDVRSRVDRVNNPFLDRREQRNDAGLDVKYGLTSSLTLTGTINPDFGQVEVDPAVVNLGQFETFYPEKRPFFTEGVNVFAFGDTPAPTHFNFINAPRLFYSRRIGRSPQMGFLVPEGAAPAETTILGAAKVTGKLANGWSMGVLDALTDAERAHSFGEPQVEPMTNYLVSRMTKEIGKSRLGFMFNSVNRRLPDELSSLRRSALSGGVDGYLSIKDRSWILEGFAVGSRVSGSEESIALTQESSSRYYQRPDAGHVEFDPTRTSLTGWGGKAMLSKSTGLWRPNIAVQAYSPGFETNDTGFLQRTDIVSATAIEQYVNQNVTSRYREKNLWFGAWTNRNFDGDTLERGVFFDHFATLANYWNYRFALFTFSSAYSDRQTRGGPLTRAPHGWSSDQRIGSDDRKRFYFTLYGHAEGIGDGSYARNVSVDLTAQPSPNLKLTLSPALNRSHDYAQFVTSFDDPAATRTYGHRYVFAELEQHSFELGTRVDWTLSPRLSFQLYAQPFVASGDYHDRRALVRARSDEYAPFDGGFEPDFNFRSVRGSAVARWEFRPGSALYIAWNENRVDVAPLGDFRFRRDLRAISTAPSHDVFLVKVSYWLPM